MKLPNSTSEQNFSEPFSLCQLCDLSKKKTCCKKFKKKGVHCKKCPKLWSIWVFLQLMRLCVNILLLLSLRVSFAQQVSSDSSFQCSLKTGITRLDFFSGLEGVYCDEHLVFLSSFELGVNRTFFQQHIFPRASVGFGYRFVIGPMQFDPLMMFSPVMSRIIWSR